MPFSSAAGGGAWRKRGADLAELGPVSGGAKQQPGRAADHRGAHEGGIGRLRDLTSTTPSGTRALLDRIGLAGQQAFIDEKIAGLDDPAIGRHQVAGGQHTTSPGTS